MKQSTTENGMNVSLAKHQSQMALQQELMAAISHEILNPVARLSFAAQLMKDSIQESVPDLSNRQHLTRFCDEMSTGTSEKLCLID